MMALVKVGDNASSMGGDVDDDSDDNSVDGLFDTGTVESTT
jgi:hypothetical protein